MKFAGHGTGARVEQRVESVGDAAPRPSSLSSRSAFRVLLVVLLAHAALHYTLIAGSGAAMEHAARHAAERAERVDAARVRGDVALPHTPVYVHAPSPMVSLTHALSDHAFEISFIDAVAVRRNREFCQWHERRVEQRLPAPGACVAAPAAGRGGDDGDAHKQGGACAGARCDEWSVAGREVCERSHAHVDARCCRWDDRVEVRTSFEYDAAWSPTLVDSSRFAHPLSYANPRHDPMPALASLRAGDAQQVHTRALGHGSGASVAALLIDGTTFARAVARDGGVWHAAHLTWQHVERIGERALAAGFYRADQRYYYSAIADHDATRGDWLRRPAEFFAEGVVDLGGTGVCTPGDIRVSFDTLRLPDAPDARSVSALGAIVHSRLVAYRPAAAPAAAPDVLVVRLGDHSPGQLASFAASSAHATENISLGVLAVLLGLATLAYVKHW